MRAVEISLSRRWFTTGMSRDFAELTGGIRATWAPTCFIFVALTFSPIKEFTRSVAPTPGPFGVLPYVFMQAALLVVLLMCGIVGRRSQRWGLAESLALWSALGLFVLASTLAALRHELQSESFLVVGTVLGVALWRLPGKVELVRVLEAVCALILLLVIAVFIVNWRNIATNGTSLPDVVGMFTQGGANVGLDGVRSGRFTAFYLYPISLGIVGGLFLIVASLRDGWRRWMLGLSGIALVLAPLSRTAAVAVVVALVPLLWYSSLAQRLRWIRPLVIVIGMLFGLAVAYVSATKDPDLSGRSGIWVPIIKALPDGWHFGLGVDGMNALNLSIGQSPDVQAHNMFLDAIARNGILALLLLIATVVAAFVASLQAARRGFPQAMALVVLVTVVGLAEPALDFRTWNESWALLLAALLISQWARNQPEDQVRTST